MRILVHELNVATVRQKITPTENLLVYAMRPYLFRWLAPAGTVFLRVTDADGRKIKDSEAITISSIGTGNYWHGYQKFLIDVALKADESYYVKLMSSGYTYGALAYVGWVSSHSLNNAFASSYSGANGQTAPLGLQLWSYKFPTKGDL